MAPDEAHYWDWSRHLDWSYYSKGPLVAWLIHGSVFLFGSFAESISGTMSAAVRVPAVLCGAIFLLGIWRLARNVFHSDQIAFYSVLIAAISPTVNAFSIMMTIDAPYLTCWVWASVLGFESIRDQSRIKWLLTGSVIAIGILAKYTMLVWLGSFALFLVADRSRRHLLWSTDFWLMTCVAALSAVPILIWNSTHDWVTFRHVAGQAGVSGKATGGIRWMGPVIFVLGQAAIYLVYWFAIGVWSMWVNRPGKQHQSEIQYLWWLCVPTLLFFAAVSMLAPVQLNWAAGAYVTGLLLAIDWLRKSPGLRSDAPGPLPRRTFVAFLTLSVLVSVGIHDTSRLTRLVSPWLPVDSLEKPTRIRQIDAAARLKGWRHFASRIDEIRQEIRSSGQEDPILTALRWDLPGEIGFYCEGHPTVYSLGLAMGDRHSQYDWWRSNPLADAQEFLGKTFIFVGVPGVEFALEGAFDKVDPPVVISHHEGERAVAQWSVWVCRGYRGFGDQFVQKVNARH